MRLPLGWTVMCGSGCKKNRNRRSLSTLTLPEPPLSRIDVADKDPRTRVERRSNCIRRFQYLALRHIGKSAHQGKIDFGWFAESDGLEEDLFGYILQEKKEQRVIHKRGKSWFLRK
ncbi:hypothetical protein K0M31_015405 [Melipona bicolor]|uniref:Uncharacterized protein n=1 Tax=Melipona bicolor TaxID=60889 RepID=A0AA40KFE5_9HYME|nr:hypothetical protein K0M31_015405 [Melipona bicolor]